MKLLTKIMAVSLALTVFSQVGMTMDYRNFSHPTRKHRPSWKKIIDDREILTAMIDRERAAHVDTLREAVNTTQTQMILCTSQAEAIEKLLQKINEQAEENKRQSKRIEALEDAIATVTTAPRIWADSRGLSLPLHTSTESQAFEVALEISERKRMSERAHLLSLIEERNLEIAELKAALYRRTQPSMLYSPVISSATTSRTYPHGRDPIPEYKLPQ